MLRLLVKDVLIGPEKITIRHRIPVREPAARGGSHHDTTDTEGDMRESYQLCWGVMALQRGMRSYIVRERGRASAATVAGQAPAAESDYSPGTSVSAYSAEYALSNDGGVLQLRGHRTALFGAWSGLDDGRLAEGRF